MFLDILGALKAGLDTFITVFKERNAADMKAGANAVKDAKEIDKIEKNIAEKNLVALRLSLSD